MKAVAIDVETIADPRMLNKLPPVVANKSLKNPEKIKADIAKKRQNQILDMGKSPLTNMICTFGWYDFAKNSGAMSIKEATEDGEGDLLINIWELLRGYDKFVTFNGRNFDIPCLLLHGIHKGVMPSVKIDNGKYQRAGSNHIDLRSILAGEGSFAKGTLDFFAKKFMGIDEEHNKTEGMTGAQVQAYWDMGLIEDIEKYCVQDCKVTMELLEKVLTAGLI